MNRPCAWVAVWYTVGIGLGWLCPVPLAGLFTVALGVWLAAAFHPAQRPRWLAILLVIAGWVNLDSRTAVLSPCDLRQVMGDTAELVTVQGRLASAPELRESSRGGRPTVRTLAWIEVEQIRRGDAATVASGRIVAGTPGVLPRAFTAGSPVRVYGVLRPPARAPAEGLFDYASYLRWLGVHFELQCQGTNDWQLEPGSARPPGTPWSERFLVWAQRTLARGLPVEDEPLRLMWAMTLGWKTALTDEVSTPFTRTGTMHVFAISGLHVALVQGILVALLRVLQVPRSACGLLVIPLIWTYTAATGWQASAIRSTLMTTVVLIGWALRRPSNLVNSLAAAGLILLLWEPRQLFQAGFQLSFGVVLSLALFAPGLEPLRTRWLQPDPFLPRDLRPKWQRWIEPVWLHVWMGLRTSWAAWLGSAPLIAHYFHLLTPVSLLANLFIVPLSSLALMSGLGSLVCGDWLPSVGVLFNHSAWAFMALMIHGSEWGARIPGGWWFVPQPSPAFFALYYLVWLGWLAGAYRHPGWRRWTWAATVLGVIAWIGPVFARWPASQITLLPLRGGAAQFVDNPGRSRDVLIDTGDEASGRAITSPFLAGQGVNRLSWLALTHGDVRHVGGAEALITLFHPEHVVTSPIRFRSPAYRQVKARLEATKGVGCTRVWEETFAGWRVLYPGGNEVFPQADDNSLVLLGEMNGVRVLLLGDLGPRGQQALLQRGGRVSAEIVVAGLPTQGEPLVPELLVAVQPQVIILMDAEFPASQRASIALRSRLEGTGIPFLCGSDEGAVTVTIKHGVWWIRTMAGRRLTSSRAERGAGADPP